MNKGTPLLSILSLLAVALAGCSSDGGDEQAAPDDVDFGDLDVEATSTTGAIRGVVVDGSIRPIAEANVVLRTPGGTEETTSDSEGRFAFSEVDPGTHFLEVTKLNHEPAQVSVTVVAGDDNPPVTKVLLTRLFAQEPYTDALKAIGFLTCGYSAGISAPCVVDYTAILVPGGAAPQINENSGNIRDFGTSVEAGWQAIVVELVWEPSLEGFAEKMGITVSHVNRTSGHWYGASDSASPSYMRFDVGQVHGSMQNDGSGEDMIPPGGKPDIHTIINARSHDDGTPGRVVNQEFEFFQHNFYYGVPPEGWSFANGDEPPF
ncbi:MAG: carboxypeptidase-like regulatory domain-containing protein [Thermoplasmatota archaeon]